MARAYGMDLRRRVIGAIDAGMPARAAAALSSPSSPKPHGRLRVASDGVIDESRSIDETAVAPAQSFRVGRFDLLHALIDVGIMIDAIAILGTHSANADIIIQHAQAKFIETSVLAGKLNHVAFAPESHHNRQAPTRELIDHGQHAEGTTVLGAVLDKVIRPDMARTLSLWLNAGTVIQPQPAAFGSFLRHFKAFSPPDPIDPLQVHPPWPAP